MPSDYNDWRLRQIEDEEDRREREEIDPDEWDEFCEEVVIAHTGARPYEDQSWIFGRKDV